MVSTSVTRRILTLGAADATTGWYYPDRTTTADIDMIMAKKGAWVQLDKGFGKFAGYDYTGFTNDAISEGDEILDSFGDYHQVWTRQPIMVADSLYCYECELKKAINHADRPSTSGTWTVVSAATTDPSHRQKVFLDTWITAANLKEDDNATNATTLVTLAMPDYPLPLVFGGTKNVDLIFSIGEARINALVDHDYKAYAYENDVDIDIYAIDKAGITARRLISAAEWELQTIYSTNPLGSLRGFEHGEAHSQDYGNIRLWSKRVTIHYTRKKTE